MGNGKNHGHVSNHETVFSGPGKVHVLEMGLFEVVKWLVINSRHSVTLVSSGTDKHDFYEVDFGAAVSSNPGSTSGSLPTIC